MENDKDLKALTNLALIDWCDSIIEYESLDPHEVKIIREMKKRLNFHPLDTALTFADPKYRIIVVHPSNLVQLRFKNSSGKVEKMKSRADGIKAIEQIPHMRDDYNTTEYRRSCKIIKQTIFEEDITTEFRPDRNHEINNDSYNFDKQNSI